MQKIPYIRIFSAAAPALAADVSGSVLLSIVQFKGTVTNVKYVPNLSISGSGSNGRRLSVTNRGSGGVGSAEPAAIQFNTGVNAAKYTPRNVPLNETEVNRDVFPGDVLTVDSGGGGPDPGGLYVVEITRTD